LVVLFIFESDFLSAFSFMAECGLNRLVAEGADVDYSWAIGTEIQNSKGLSEDSLALIYFLNLALSNA